MAVPAWLTAASEVATAASPIANLAGPVLGALGSLFGAKEQNKNVRQTNQMNLQIARENNSAQERMLQYNNAFNRSMALEMFNLENAYNSPENQVELLRQGGLNASTMYGNGSTVARSDASTPQAASSGITPSMPTLQTPPGVIGSMFGNIESLTRAASNLSSSSLNQAQKNRINLLVDEELNQLIAKNALTGVQTQMENLHLKFEREFGRLDRQTDLGMKVSNIWLNFQNACKAAAEGDLALSDKLLRDSQTALNDIEKGIKQATKQIIIDQENEILSNLKRTGQKINAETRAAEATAANQNAQARLTNESASQLEQMRDDNLRIKKNEATMSSAEKQFQLRTLGSRIRSFVKGNQNSLNLQEAEISKISRDLEYVDELIERARKENSTYFYRLASDELNRVLDRLNANANTAIKLVQ